MKAYWTNGDIDIHSLTSTQKGSDGSSTRLICFNPGERIQLTGVCFGGENIISRQLITQQRLP